MIRTPRRLNRRPVAALVLAALLAACGQSGGEPLADDQPPNPAQGAEVGLFTSLPLVWRETADIADHLNDPAPAHWALAVLGEAGAVRALDALVDERGALPLAPGSLLVMAQPRPLSPPENVALDAWVRGGGQELLFADPMLTFESLFSLGDRRRPQDVVLLSPILSRWGLALVFDDAQPPGPRLVSLPGAVLPVNLPGRFRAAGPDCALLAEGVIADCGIGGGRVLAVADAALFDGVGADDDGRAATALRWAIDRLND